MKKIWVFLLGTITGCFFTFITLVLLGAVFSNSRDVYITPAEQQVPFTEATRFKIIQVLDNGALALCEDKSYSDFPISGMAVYLPAQDHVQYYNDQIIEVPKGKRAMQIGTFRYPSHLGEKVVPVIKFL